MKTVKLNLTADQKAELLKAMDAARADAKGDFLKLSTLDMVKDCIERGEIDDVTYALLDLSALLTTGKEMPHHPILKPAKRKRTPTPKIRRGVGSY